MNYHTEATKMLDAYVFLFNDVLLITKIKRAPKVSTYCVDSIVASLSIHE